MKPKPTKKEIVTEFRTREILAAARRLMQDRGGVETVTMEEIAGAAGVAKGTVYLYFQGKEDLIQALLSQSGENLVQGLKALLETPGSAAEKLQRVVSFLLNFLEEERVLFPVYARECSSGPNQERQGRGRRIQELEEEFVARLSGFFAEGIAAGRFIPADPRLLTFMVRELVRAVGYYQMAESQKDAINEAVPVMQALLATGLLAGSPDAGGGR